MNSFALSLNYSIWILAYTYNCWGLNLLSNAKKVLTMNTVFLTWMGFFKMQSENYNSVSWKTEYMCDINSYAKKSYFHLLLFYFLFYFELNLERRIQSYWLLLKQCNICVSYYPQFIPDEYNPWQHMRASKDLNRRQSLDCRFYGHCMLPCTSPPFFLNT